MIFLYLISSLLRTRSLLFPYAYASIESIDGTFSSFVSTQCNLVNFFRKYIMLLASKSLL